MRALESIRLSLEMGMGFSGAMLRDMADEPLVRTTPGVGQHAYWLLGHLVVSEGAVLDQYLHGRPNRYAAWAGLFGIGTTPGDTTSGGPTYDELLTSLDDVRRDILAYVDTLTDEDLDGPCHENDWPGPEFDSVGACLGALGFHMGIHGGQAACVRRAAGRQVMQY